LARCSVCGAPAVYVNRATGQAFCARHFLEYFDRRVRATIRRFRLFRPRERIVVAVSGGKDSLALLHYLVGLSRRAAPGWEVRALLIDEGIRGYRELTIRRFERVAGELGVEYRIARFRDYLGYTLDEIVRIGRERGLPYKPCTYCGVFRRYLMNRVAREMGATVVATGHNLDDIVQTYMMNILGNDWEKVARLGPVSGPSRHPRFVRKVKPFYEVLEKETTLYAILHGLYEGFEECPYAVLGERWEIRRMINRLEEQRPGTKYRLLRSLLSALEILRRAGVGEEGEVGTCAICGEPSSHPVCRACMLRLELGILRLSKEEMQGLPPEARRMVLHALRLAEKRRERAGKTGGAAGG
jgi:uncharacterized protein (TIGR00269 family)